MILKSIFWHTESQCSDFNNTLNQNWDKYTEYILCSFNEAACCVYKLLKLLKMTF